MRGPERQVSHLLAAMSLAVAFAWVSPLLAGALFLGAGIALLRLQFSAKPHLDSLSHSRAVGVSIAVGLAALSLALVGAPFGYVVAATLSCALFLAPERHRSLSSRVE